MRRLGKKAKEQVAARVGFTKHLNIWVQGEKAWMDMARWENAVIRLGSFNFGQLVIMWLGVDLSNKIDISAAVKVWLRSKWRCLYPLPILDT